MVITRKNRFDINHHLWRIKFSEPFSMQLIKSIEVEFLSVII